MKQGFIKKISVLQWALLASAAVHAALLTVRFVDPEGFNRVFEDTPLEVILVNARGDEAPDKAQAIAQANLAGGGDAADPRVRATTPLPPSAYTQMGDAITDEMQQRIDSLLEQQNLMLAQVRHQLAALPAADPDQPRNEADEKERDEKRQQLFRLLDEIEQRINEENARPKKRFISPATREEVYALYYDTLRRKIEQRGTANFPQAGGQKLYGALTMIMTINHDGRVLAVEVAETSGNLTLDRRAVAIAQSAAPFEHFGGEMRKKADQIVVVSRFTFTHDQTLQTQMMGSAS